MWLLDDDRRYIAVNDHTVNLMGISREKLVSMRREDLVPAELKEGVVRDWDRFLAEGYNVVHYSTMDDRGFTLVADWIDLRDVLPGCHLSITVAHETIDPLEGVSLSETEPATVVICGSLLDCTALESLLGRLPDFDVVGVAEGAEECVRKLTGHHPDVLIQTSDTGATRAVSSDLIERYGKASPKTQVLVLSSVASPIQARETLKAGATAFVIRDDGVDALADAVRAAAKGEPYVNPRIAAEIARLTLNVEDQLSDREAEVMRLVALGYTNKEIGELTFLSTRTIESHRANISYKLGLGSRADLVRYAIENGVFDPSRAGIQHSIPH